MKIFSALILILLVHTSGQSMPLDVKQRALTVIADFSDRMCVNFSMQGNSSKQLRAVDARLELNALFKILVNAGVSIGTRVKDERYIGLMQEDLMRAIQLRNDCKRYYFNSLSEMLLTDAPTVLKTEMMAGKIVTNTISSEGVFCTTVQTAGNISESCEPRKE